MLVSSLQDNLLRSLLRRDVLLAVESLDFNFDLAFEEEEVIGGGNGKGLTDRNQVELKSSSCSSSFE